MQWVSLNQAAKRGGIPRGYWSLFIAGVASALLVPTMVVVLGLVADLLTSRGHLELSAEQVEAVEAWAGKADRVESRRAIYQAKGLLPLVYRHRHTPVVGGALVGVYQSAGWMRSNIRCLVVLLILGTFLAALESLTLGLFYLNLSRASLEVGARLRGAIYDQAFRLGVFDLLGRRVTQAEELISEQVPLVEKGLRQRWCGLARYLVLAAGSILLALLANIWLALVVLLFAVLAWLLYSWLNGRTENQTRLYEDRASRELDRLLEQLRQVPLVVGYLLSRVPGEPRDDTLRRYRQHAEQSGASGMLVGPVMLLFVMAGVALIAALVGVNLFRQPPGITVSGTVVLGTSMLLAFFPARRLMQIQRMMPSSERAAAAILAYLSRETSVVETAAARPLPRIKDRIALEDVTLADRQGLKILDSVSLEIPLGSKTAIVASDSSVPIALAGLLARFYDPAAGRILCDTQEARLATLQSLRQQVSVVMGNGQLVSDTVSENIACGESRFTQAQITDAAKLAGAYEFVLDLPQGFATPIGPQGVPLERGQAFRIALARAALRDPAILVLQEPRVRSDAPAVGDLDEAMQRLARDRAVVLLPRRLETLRSADRVYLIHQGEVVGEGTHTELIQSSELYRHLTYVRFNEYRGQVDVD
jgi:ABC-type multidrug transport system fused ATPase/permease subunit